jgi:hypothetical protein
MVVVPPATNSRVPSKELEAIAAVTAVGAGAAPGDGGGPDGSAVEVGAVEGVIGTGAPFSFTP